MNYLLSLSSDGRVQSHRKWLSARFVISPTTWSDQSLVILLHTVTSLKTMCLMSSSSPSFFFSWWGEGYAGNNDLEMSERLDGSLCCHQLYIPFSQCGVDICLNFPNITQDTLFPLSLAAHYPHSRKTHPKREVLGAMNLATLNRSCHGTGPHPWTHPSRCDSRGSNYQAL